MDVGTKICAFMDRVESSAYVVLLLSDHYLRSKYCMYEAVKVVLSLLKNNCRIIPIALDIDLANRDIWEAYVHYWEQMREAAGNDPLLAADALLYKDIRDSIREFFLAVTEHKFLSASSSEVDSVLLSRVVAAVTERMELSSGI